MSARVEAAGTGRRAALPSWAVAVVAFLATALVYLVVPRLAPVELGGETAALALGLVNGVTMGISLRLGREVTAWIALGAGAGTLGWLLSVDHPEVLLFAAAIAVGIELWTLPVLLRRWGADRLGDPGDLLRYGAVVLAVTLPVGLAVALVAAGDHVSGGRGVLDLWRLWVIDDLFGLVVVTPAVLSLHRPSTWSWGQPVEFSLAVAYTAVATWYVFFDVTEGANGLIGWPYVVTLGSIWIAVRFGAKAVAPVLAVQFWLALIGTVQGSGAFAEASDDPLERLLVVELFAIVMSATILALGLLRDGRARLDRQLKERARFFQEVVDGSGAAIFAKSYADAGQGGGRYVLANAASRLITGLSEEEEAVGRTDADMMPVEVAEGFVAVDRAVLASGEARLTEQEVVWADGSTHVYSSLLFPLTNAEGRRWGVAGVATDITELLESRRREARQAELLRAVFELSPTPAVRLTGTTDRQFEVGSANAAMCRLLAAPEGQSGGCDLLTHVHPDDVATALDVLTTALGASGDADVPSQRSREVRLRAEDGRVVWTVMSAAALRTPGQDPEVVAQFEDVTARRAAEQALTDQATRDAVTGLPNRRALTERIDAALQRLRRHPGWVTVLFCDLDHFKDINDSLGHQAGDALLVEVAERMRSAVRPEDTVARLGGDEFVALGEGILGPSDAILMALRLQDRLGASWLAGGKTFRPAMSIGIAMTDDPDVGVDELLRRADLAMYRAKAGGRNRVEVYERAVDDEVQRAVAIQHELRRAIDTDGLSLRYQPIVRLSDRAIIGMEALVRMQAEDGSLLSPGEFVPQAEATGLVIPMGAWVLRRALADITTLRKARGHDAVMSVNVSPTQLREPGFADYLVEQMAFADVDPKCLAVEVTETALIHDPARSGHELARLREAGVSISLDDFGTGYSSLSWLTQFPVDTVKIDKSFTDDIGIDARKTAIVTALIGVSHELGFTVVAEGVETEDQARRLVDLGCDRGQGYLFGRPTPIGEEPWTT